jgi:hypothetical protein
MLTAHAAGVGPAQEPRIAGGNLEFDPPASALARVTAHRCPFSRERSVEAGPLSNRPVAVLPFTSAMSDRPHGKQTWSSFDLEFYTPEERKRPFFRRYPHTWMTARRSGTPSFPKSLRNIWHRRGRRAEDAALRRDPEDHVSVYGRRKPGNWWEWY